MEEERLDEFYEAVKTSVEVFQCNKEFGELLNHPQISREEKVSIMKEVFGCSIPGELMELMKLMVTKGRAAEIISVLQYFIGLVKETKKIGIADVTTAIELTENQKKKVEERLLETTRYKEFEMHYHVDSSLIGGLVIRIGDRVVDSSIKTKL